MDDAFRRFADGAAGADAALFFYGGHGFQFQGANYLVPVDAKLTGAADIGTQMARVDDILADLQRASGVRILDARRLPRQPACGPAVGAGQSRARRDDQPRGLARIKQTAGTVIAYSTQPGAVAADGGRAQQSVRGPRVHLRGEPARCRDRPAVPRMSPPTSTRATNERQLPEVTFSLLGDFYFVGQRTRWRRRRSPPRQRWRAQTAALAPLDNRGRA